ncbi:glutamic acid-rich protein-like [Papaver somniferum]|uniref:glutamic acid-rich protein-like n=1 Tax=Papaver somniferum TaxID=3469 RepID=UPI000E700DC6|nr:glutamic acid-rich protein-like [Papaver somniferum]
MATSSSNNYDYNYSSSSSDEDSKVSAAKSKAKTTHDEGVNPSIPLNDRRVTYAELMKRKAETDETEDHKRRKDRIRHKIRAAEERRRFVDGVPSDSDADASEEETTWVLPERKIKLDRRTRELQKTMKQVEPELETEAEEDSDDPYTHPDFINDPGSDSDEEEDSEKDSDDESDSSDESDE